MIRRICMYCQTQYGIIDCEDTGDSHGICPDCAKLPDHVKAEMGRKVRAEKARKRGLKQCE